MIIFFKSTQARATGATAIRDAADIWTCELNTSYWLPAGDHERCYAAGSRRRIAVHTGVSATTCWRLTLGQPGRHLHDSVHSYLEYEEVSTRPVTRRELPGPAAALIIELAEPRSVASAENATAVARPPAYLCRPKQGPTLIWHSGAVHCLQVRLTLLGTYRLFGSMTNLDEHLIPLENVWPAAAVLREQLVAAGDVERRFDHLDNVLGQGIAAGPEPDPEVSHVWRRLQSVAGTAAIDDLRAEVGWSRGRLAARFDAQTGLTPKAAATILRFHHAVRRIEHANAPLLTEIAGSCGYHDQAHLNHDFRRFAGCSPTEWRRSKLVDLPGAASTPGSAPNISTRSRGLADLALGGCTDRR